MKSENKAMFYIYKKKEKEKEGEKEREKEGRKEGNIIPRSKPKTGNQNQEKFSLFVYIKSYKYYSLDLYTHLHTDTHIGSIK